MHVVIIGGGQAGGWAAKTLRDAQADIRVTMVAEEAHPPYERPPLSKDVLLGLKPPASTHLWPDLPDIEIRNSVRAEAIIRETKQVRLADGSRLDYDKLILATGGRVRTIDIPNAHYLRTIDDSMRLREALAKRGRVLIVGGGWIGLEAAAAAVKSGCAATIVESATQLCGRSVPGVMSDYLLSLHTRNGVDIRLNASHANFSGDTTIVGIGIIPNVELAQAAGLQVANGIIVDEHGRTSDPDIFAVGDVANLRGIRLESWANAQNQAIATAQYLLGSGKPYNETPWFWSDQFNANIQVLGLPQKHHPVVLRGNPNQDKFALFLMEEDRIAAFVAVNSGRDVRLTRRFIESKTPVSDTILADDKAPLSGAALGAPAA